METNSSIIRPQGLNQCHLLLGEVNDIVSAMKFNKLKIMQADQSSNLVKTVDGSLQSFIKLQKTLEGLPHRGPQSLDGLDYLQPFLDVIKSDDITAPITAMALSAIHKFVQCGFLSVGNAYSERGVRSIVLAVARCRFKTLDNDTTQIVLFRILNLLKLCLTSPVGALLTNKLVYEMTQTCFKMSTQIHLNALLRKAAEMTLIEMVYFIFSQFNGSNLCDEAGEKELDEWHGEEVFSNVASPVATPLHGSIVHERDGEESEQGDRPEGGSEERSEPTESAPTLTAPTSNSNDATSPSVTPNPSPLPANDQAAAQSNGPVTPISPMTSPMLMKRESRFSERKTSRYFAGTDFDVEIEKLNGDMESSAGDTPKKEDGQQEKPYSYVVLVKLLSFFSGLIQPENVKNTDSVKLLGINLINAVVETQAYSITQIKKLNDFFKDDLMKCLLQAYLATEMKSSVMILTTLLRIFFNIFMSMASEMKFQLSIFLTYSLFLLKEEERTTVEQKELIVSNLVQMLKEPSFALDLYLNFDCDINSDNFFQDIMEFFFKHATKHEKSPSNMPAKDESGLSVLALDGLTAILQSIFKRLKTPCDKPLPELQVDVIKQRKHLKETLQTAAKHFSVNYNTCFEYLQEKKLLPTPHDAKSVALFLLKTPFLSKTSIGEYLGKRHDFNIEVLKEYCKLIPIDESTTLVHGIRMFLESFRPMGESPVIERYLECFLDHFLAHNHSIEASLDDVFSLTYSIIMLNVELHSPTLVDKPKMTLAQYKKNLSFGGFDDELLTSIYEEVEDDEIKIHREHLFVRLHDNTWRHLYDEAKSFSNEHFYFTIASAQHYDSLFFNSIWRKINAATKHYFSTTRNHDILDKSMTSFQMCALISSRYKLVHASDNLVITLCELSTILHSPVKKFAIHFGKTDRAHYATIALFTIARKHSNNLRESWRNIVNCMVRLSCAELLPAEAVVTWKDALGFPGEELQPVEEKQAGGFTNWLLGGGGWFTKSDEPLNDTQRKYEDVSRKTVKQCKIDALVAGSASFNADSLQSLVRAIALFATPLAEDSLFLPQADKGTASGNTLTPGDIQNAAIFCLKLFTEIIILNKHRIQLVWPLAQELFVQLHQVFQNPLYFNYVYTGVTCVFNLASHLASAESIWSSVLQLFQLFSKFEFNASIEHKKLAKKISTGIRIALIENVMDIKQIEDWVVVSNLLKWTYSSGNLLDGVDALCHITMPQKRNANDTSKPATPLTPTNFPLIFDLLTQFMNNNKQPHKNNDIPAKLLGAFYNLIANSPLFFIDHNLGMQEAEVLEKCIIPALQYLETISLDVKLGVHSAALPLLGRALLAPELITLSVESWVTILDNIVFHILTELLKSPSSLSKELLEDRRLKAAQGILCKTFLQYLTKFIESPVFVGIWKKTLNYIEMYMKAGKSDLLHIALTEALKNILMVLYSSGVMLESAEPLANSKYTRKEFCDLTWLIINQFAPGLELEFKATVAISEKEKQQLLDTPTKT